MDDYFLISVEKHIKIIILYHIFHNVAGGTGAHIFLIHFLCQKIIDFLFNDQFQTIFGEQFLFLFDNAGLFVEKDFL